MRKLIGPLAVAALGLAVASAQADSGSITDPEGDYPDIVKLAYNNADQKVVMTMTHDGFRPQNESFYIRWGDGRYYQVFRSSTGPTQLRLNSSANVKACNGLKEAEPTAKITKVTVPRSCIGKAPNKLRFQGIATEGLGNFDETKVSKPIARG